MWIREPFNGGCRYNNEDLGVFVVGYYDYPKLEADCDSWTASNVPEWVFSTPDEAMDASEVAAS